VSDLPAVSPRHLAQGRLALEAGEKAARQALAQRATSLRVSPPA